MPTDIDLDAIAARAAAATEGPWIHLTVEDGDDDGPNGEERATRRWSTPLAAVEDIWFEAEAVADAEFIAGARSDVPALLAKVEKLEADLAETETVHGSSLIDMADLQDDLAEARAALAAEKEAHGALRERVRSLAHWCDTVKNHHGETGYVFTSDLRAVLDTDTTTEARS